MRHFILQVLYCLILTLTCAQMDWKRLRRGGEISYDAFGFPKFVFHSSTREPLEEETVGTTKTINREKTPAERKDLKNSVRDSVAKSRAPSSLKYIFETSPIQTTTAGVSPWDFIFPESTSIPSVSRLRLPTGVTGSAFVFPAELPLSEDMLETENEKSNPRTSTHTLISSTETVPDIRSQLFKFGNFSDIKRNRNFAIPTDRPTFDPLPSPPPRPSIFTQIPTSVNAEPKPPSARPLAPSLNLRQANFQQFPTVATISSASVITSPTDTLSQAVYGETTLNTVLPPGNYMFVTQSPQDQIPQPSYSSQSYNSGGGGSYLPNGQNSQNFANTCNCPCPGGSIGPNPSYTGPTVTNSPCNRNTIGYQLPGVQSVDTSGYYFFGPPLKGL